MAWDETERSRRRTLGIEIEVMQRCARRENKPVEGGSPGHYVGPDELGRPVRVGIPDDAPILIPVSAFVGIDGILTVVIGRKEHVHSIVLTECHAAGERRFPIVAVAATRCARLGVASQALEVGVEHEVHDTRDGVRTIGCRRATGHRLHGAQQILRKDADVGAAESRRRHDATPVEQHECPVRANAAQVQVSRARARKEALRVVWRAIAEKERQLAQRVDDIARSHELELLTRHSRDGSRRFHAGCLLNA